MPNQKLLEYIHKQKVLKVSNEDIKKQLLNSGWREEEIDKAFILPNNSGKSDNKGFQISLFVVGLLILLGLGFYLILGISKKNLPNNIGNPPKSFKIDPSILEKNDSLLAEIENQEEELHNILHNDLINGKIPLSKEVAILFRIIDLLHLQNQLNLISHKIDVLQYTNSQDYSQADVDKMQNEMKKTQADVSVDLSDKTHDGTIKPTWFLPEK